MILKKDNHIKVSILCIKSKRINPFKNKEPTLFKIMPKNTTVPPSRCELIHLIKVC